LAIFEDGFSNVTEIRTSITEAKEKSHGLEAKVGASNLFALLGISGGGSLSARNAESGGLTAKTEKIHTPTSLFNKLRSLLDQRGLLKNLAENGANLLSIKSGDFLETNTILIKNPIMDTFQGLLQLMTFSLPFLEENKVTNSDTGGRKSQKQSHQPKNENQKIINQMKVLVDALSSGATIDLIGKTVPLSDTTLVLSSQIRFFLNESYDEILDGEYRVLAKVVRTMIRDSSESINLLRKTTFSRIQDSLFHKMMSGLKDIEQNGLKPVELVTEITGPAIHLLPIAIYV
jgi:hypothetical protein